MAENLPEHDHCIMCDDPVEVGGRFCSELCQEEYEKGVRRDRNRNLLFVAAVIVILAVMGVALQFLT